MPNTTCRGSSTPHYAQSTIESRNKNINRQGTTSSGKVKGNSPDRKSPRLCEEDGLDVHDIKIKITTKSESNRNRRYAAEDYGDTDADVWHRYNDTHSSRGIVPTPPTSTSGRTSQRGRQRRLLQPSTKAEFENRREKAQRNLSPRREDLLKDEQEFIDQIRRLTEENKDLKKLERDHRKCETKQQEIHDLLNRYKGQLEISENKCLSFEDDNKIFAKMLEKEKQYNNASKLNHEQEMKMLKNKHETELRKYASQLDRMTKEKQNMLEKDLQRNNANISKYKNDIEMYKKMAEERKTEINRLNHLVEDKEKKSREFESNYERTIKLLNKYKASMESTADMEEQIREHQSKYEKMVRIIEQFKAVNKESNEARYKMEHQLQRKIDDLASVEETHRACLEIRDEQKLIIRDLKNELSACEKNYEMLHQEYDELNVRLEEEKMKNQSKEMSAFQNMEKEVSVLLMEKEIAVNKLQDADDTIQELQRNLEKRENRIRSLTEQLLRSEEKASKLSDKLKDARDDRKEVVEESLQRLQIQNENQKLVLVQATKRAEDLSKQSLSLQRYKDEAERITNNLSKDLNEHVKKNESLDKQVKQLLERNATILRDKESAVIQINKLTSILHDKEREIQSLIGERSRFAETSEETEKTLRKDVSSYRSAYDKMARENGNLSEQCSTVQKEKASLLKDKEDAQKQIMDLKRTSQSMERKIESLTNDLTSYRNSNEDLLSIHDKEKGLFEKDKKSAGIEINDLKRALHDKEKKIESLNDELRRFKEHVAMLSNEVQFIQESKEQAVSNSEKRFHTENASLQSDYKKAILKNSELTEQCFALKEEKVNLIKDKEDGQRQIKELRQSSQAKERKIESLTNELTSYRNSNEDLLSIHDKEKGLFEKDKKRAGIEISELKRVLQDKEKEIGTLNDELRRNGDLSEQCSALQKEKTSLLKDKEDAQKQIKELKRTSQSMERKIESLTNELTNYRNSNEDLLSIHDKEKGLFEKDKKRAGIEINDLKRALHDKEKEIGSINDELNRFKEHVAMLSNEVQLIQKSREETVSNSEKRFHKEKASLESDYEKAILKINEISKECANLHKDKKSTALLVEKLSKTVEDREAKIHSLEAELSRFEEQISRLSDEIKTLHSSKGRAADEKMQELIKANYSLKTDLTKAKSKYEDLSKKCENMLMENEDAAHNIRQLTRDVQDKDQEIKFLNTELTRVEDTVQELKDQKRDGQNTEQKISKLSKAVRDKEDEIESLIDQLSQSEDKNAALEEKMRNVKIDGGSVQERIQQLQEENASLKSALVQTSAESKDKIAALEEKFRNMKAGGGSTQERIQQLQKENTSLKSALVQKSTEAEAEISDLLKQIAHLKKSAKPYPGEHRDTHRPNDDSAFLRAKLDDVNRSLEKLRRDYDVVKKEKDHALNRLSAVAGEKLRDNNPGIADLSDENRPINLGEKFSQLYDDQWTDAIENLEEMKYTETDGIRYLIDILKRVFDECVRISEDNFGQLQELTGTTNLPSDQLKKLKDLRKATAVHSVNKVKPLVNKVMSTVFKNEKDACQTYIDRSIELCWLMSVQDPPVVIDFIAVRGTDIDDQKFRKFTKTGTKIDFLVWPVIRLHKNGPPLQKGVVQPI